MANADRKPVDLKIKDQILHCLKMRGPQTAAVLAEQLQVSAIAIRQHLQSLKSEGWVTYREEKRPMGRPVKLWQLTHSSNGQFPDRHMELMQDLMRSAEAVFGRSGLEQIVAERGHQQSQNYLEELESIALENWRDRLQALAAIRDREGYMTEVVESEADLILVENHCPIFAAAHTCEGLCHAELEVFRCVLGPGVTIERVEHLLGGDRRCAYRVHQH